MPFFKIILTGGCTLLNFTNLTTIQKKKKLKNINNGKKGFDL